MTCQLGDDVVVERLQTCSQCVPCFIPENNLSLSINGGTPTTLVFPGWSDGTHTLACTANLIALTGGGTWALGTTQCNPMQYVFTSGANTAVITSIGSITCPDCGNNCITCNSNVVGTFNVVDTLGSHTAVWNKSLSQWITPQLCTASGTLAPVENCVGGNTVCRFGAGPWPGNVAYYYGIKCTSLGHMTIYRYWFQGTCINPTYQYMPCNCTLATSYAQESSSSGSVAVTCGSIAWGPGSLGSSTGTLADPVGGNVSFSGNALGQSSCCQTFTMSSCYYSTPDLVGTIVNVYVSNGGALLASGATNSSYLVSLLWAGSCHVYVTAHDPSGRFADYGSLLTLTANGTTAITLSAASGYVCPYYEPCVYPMIAGTLHCTFANAGAQTFAYSGGTWTCSFVYLTITYVFSFDIYIPYGTLVSTANGVDFSANCTWTYNSCPLAFSLSIVPGGIGAPVGNGAVTE